MAEREEVIKNVVDAVVFPSGFVAIASHYIDLANGILTFCVLVTSLVWGVYRIIETYERRVSAKAKVKNGHS